MNTTEFNTWVQNWTPPAKQEVVEPEITPIAEGDILLANWGYDANNPTFVKVLKRSGTFATLAILRNTSIGSDNTDGGNGYGHYVIPTDEISTWSCFANDDHQQGEPVIIRRKIKDGGKNYGEYVKLPKVGHFAYAYKWDNRPAHDYNNH